MKINSIFTKKFSMIYFSSNIKILRKKQGFTQENFAKKIGVSRAVVGSYEEGRAVPKLQVLQEIAKLFSISVDDLLGHDFTKNPSNAKNNTQTKSSDLRILPIVVDREEKEFITVVPLKAAAGYLSGYTDPEFVESLPRFSLPLPELSRDRTYRVFQIQGDSMLPVATGSYIISEFIDNFHDLKNGQACIVLTEDDGIVFKRLFTKKDKKDQLILKSDNPSYESYTIHYSKINEIWKALGFISFKLSEPDEINIENLSRLVLDMKQEIETIKKKK